MFELRNSKIYVVLLYFDNIFEVMEIMVIWREYDKWFWKVMFKKMIYWEIGWIGCYYSIIFYIIYI